MNKKWLTALALSGFLLAGGSAFAMEPTINVDSSTANMPNKAESHLLKVNVVTPEIKQISGVVYEQVPSRGYENVAMKMDSPVNIRPRLFIKPPRMFVSMENPSLIQVIRPDWVKICSPCSGRRVTAGKFPPKI